MSARVRLVDQNNVDPHAPVCIGLFRGGYIAYKEYGANRRGDALRELRKLRAQGVGARLTWLNVGPWCAELWVSDLGRDLETHPDVFYGPLDIHAEYEAA